jgi:2,5-diketo-D-gluconate reductase A
MGMGTWKLVEDTAESVARGIQLGFRMVDTSGDYGTQPGVGDGIRLSGTTRDNLYVVTKVEETDDTYEAARQNLDELKLECVDLLLLHRPPKKGFGEELWRGLVRAKREGMARDIGVSNYSVDQIQSLIDATREVPVVNQIEWTPFGHSKEMLGYAQENQIVLQAYSPLTRGERLDDPTLENIAADYGKTTSQVLIRWNLQHGVVPVIKAGNPDHMAENLDVFDFELTGEDMRTLDALNEEYSALGPKLVYTDS